MHNERFTILCNTCYILAGIDRFTDDYGFIVGVQYLFLGQGEQTFGDALLLETIAFGELVLIVTRALQIPETGMISEFEKVCVVCYLFCNCPLCTRHNLPHIFLLIGNFLMDHLVILYTCFCLLLLPEQM